MSHQQVSFFKMSQYFNATRPEDQAMNCAQMKRKACNPDLKVGNLQDKDDLPFGSVLKIILKYLHQLPGACHILKTNTIL